MEIQIIYQSYYAKLDFIWHYLTASLVHFQLYVSND
jgi:hypothetical protein